MGLEVGGVLEVIDGTDNIFGTSSYLKLSLVKLVCKLLISG